MIFNLLAESGALYGVSISLHGQRYRVAGSCRRFCSFSPTDTFSSQAAPGANLSRGGGLRFLPLTATEYAPPTRPSARTIEILAVRLPAIRRSSICVGVQKTRL